MRNSLLKIAMISGCLMLGSAVAQAENLLDWIQKSSSSQHGNQPQVVDDGAVLLTLEPNESEMYPQVSPDGKQLLVVAENQKGAWVSRRSLANGDPLNLVIDEASALNSIHWQGDEKVSFIRQRSGELGLWRMHADGEGLLSRSHLLQGMIIQALPLPDGSVIAVRLHGLKSKHNEATARQGQAKQSGFNNWDVDQFESEIVHLDSTGAEKVLSAGVTPSISPDGTRIVFSMADGRSVHLYAMDVNGDNLVQITHDRSVDVQPSWSHDGHWIVFTSNREHMDRERGKSSWDVWAIDREGRQLTQLTTDPARDGAPTVASNGRVYFHSDRDIGADVKKERQVKSTRGFHVWSVVLPVIQ
ncbi:MAG: PD40 domain-containing protein [Zetaproteobacteria bacterium]|nr:PD40 domain-containing protein [Zetaproteobacteria bacterium]